jgi:hypothetical protein
MIICQIPQLAQASAVEVEHVVANQPRKRQHCYRDGRNVQVIKLIHPMVVLLVRLVTIASATMAAATAVAAVWIDSTRVASTRVATIATVVGSTRVATITTSTVITTLRARSVAIGVAVTPAVTLCVRLHVSRRVGAVSFVCGASVPPRPPSVPTDSTTRLPYASLQLEDPI